MRTSMFFLALCATALPAAADAPVYFSLPNDHIPTDVTAWQGDVIAVGYESASHGCFRWRMSTNAIEYLGTLSDSSEPRVSRDGTQICARTVGVDSNKRAARWVGGTSWVQLPDLGGSIGTDVSAGLAISGDGLTYAGYSYLNGVSEQHAFQWTQSGGVVDLGGPFTDPHSKILAANYDGTVFVGRKNTTGSTICGARWVNGVMTRFTHVQSGQTYRLLDAYDVNDAGTIAVGYGAVNAISGTQLPKAWRWDAGPNTTTLLDNYAGQTTTPHAIDTNEDGSIILGRNGQNFLADPQGVVWIANVPQRLDDWLAALGAAPPSDLEFPNGMSWDGAAMCGAPSGLGSVTSPWIVVFPEKLEIGTVYCSGDGSGTACPCSPATVPHGAAGHGCPNSLFPAGGKLRATGVARVSNDAVKLRGSNLPNGPCLYFQGTLRQSGGAGAVFGDGLRCAAGTVRRFATQSSVGNASQYPGVGNNPISVAGLIGGGDTRTYQNWYRNSNPTFCSAATFNLTNGLELVWGP